MPGEARTVSFSIATASQRVPDVNEVRAVLPPRWPFLPVGDVLDNGSAQGECDAAALHHDLRYHLSQNKYSYKYEINSKSIDPHSIYEYYGFN